MSKQSDSKQTVSHHEVTPERAVSESLTSPHRKSEKERPGAAIISSDDPSTADLRRWALDKQLQYPGQDGSFAQGARTAGVVDGMGWSGPWLLPHKGDTLPPPDERVVHGEPKIVGAGSVKETERGGERSGGENKKRYSFSSMFHRKNDKDHEAKGNEEYGDAVK